MTRAYIGIDVGGTKIAIGLVQKNGTILGQRVFATDEVSTFSGAISRITTEIKALLNELGNFTIQGIGIGAPGPLNPETGIIDNPHTLPCLSGGSLTQELSKEFSCLVKLENDADAALLGELQFGAAQGAKHAVMLTFGTGVGGAAWIEGNLLRGANGSHPELGHIAVEAGSDHECYCGRAGCLESVASGTAIGLAAVKAGFRDAEQVFEKAMKQDPRAHEIIQRVNAACHSALWTVIHAFDPEVVILGGGVMEKHYTIFFEAELSQLANAATMTGMRKLRILPAALGNSAGILGAASLVMKDPVSRLGFDLQVLSDHEEMSVRASELIVDLLKIKPDAVICLPTGNTPTRMYKLLAAEFLVQPSLFEKARFIQLDEWGGLNANHPSCCAFYLRKHLLKPLQVANPNGESKRLIEFVGDALDPQAECERVSLALSVWGGIDLCILGLGANGHLALNEPGTELIQAAHVAQLAESSMQHSMIRDLSHKQPYGLTLGMGDILGSRQILLLVSGTAKKKVLEKLRDGKLSTQFPASFLWTHRRVVCLCDREAAGV